MTFFGVYSEVLIEHGRPTDLWFHVDKLSSAHVYLRLKEKYFLNEEPGGNLTIAGFYYLCVSRSTGEISGYYFDPNSTPYQRVSLQVTYEGSGGYTTAGGDLV